MRAGPGGRAALSPDVLSYDRDPWPVIALLNCLLSLFETRKPSTFAISKLTSGMLVTSHVDLNLTSLQLPGAVH